MPRNPLSLDLFSLCLAGFRTGRAAAVIRFFQFSTWFCHGFTLQSSWVAVENLPKYQLFGGEGRSVSLPVIVQWVAEKPGFLGQ
jgi:hypothetical protein